VQHHSQDLSTSSSPSCEVLRWHLQQGRSAIPKSTRPARIADNIDVFDFDLSAEQLTALPAS
jgi:2,5-diketo-D-gluconate reductase A